MSCLVYLKFNFKSDLIYYIICYNCFKIFKAFQGSKLLCLSLEVLLFDYHFILNIFMFFIILSDYF